MTANANKPKGRGRAADAATNEQAASPVGPTVTLVRTGDVKEVAFKDGMTVKQALSSGGFAAREARSVEVRLNNKPCTDLDTVLSPGDQVMVLGNIRGA